MIQFLLAAPRSGSGKTTMTCALLMALKRRGCAPCAFKSGPDYIDPMFHRAVLGVSGWKMTGQLAGLGIMLVGVALLLAVLALYNAVYD